MIQTPFSLRGLKDVVKWHMSQPPASLLHLGSGKGEVASTVMRVFSTIKRVECVDADATSVSSKIRITRADTQDWIEHKSRGVSQFDIVIGNEGMSEEDLLSLLRNSRRLLSDGGVAILPLRYFDHHAAGEYSGNGYCNVETLRSGVLPKSYWTEIIHKEHDVLHDDDIALYIRRGRTRGGKRFAQASAAFVTWPRGPVEPWMLGHKNPVEIMVRNELQGKHNRSAYRFGLHSDIRRESYHWYEIGPHVTNPEVHRARMVELPEVVEIIQCGKLGPYRDFRLRPSKFHGHVPGAFETFDKRSRLFQMTADYFF